VKLPLVLAAALFACSPSSGDAQGVSHWRSIVSMASLRFNIPVSWIERVMRAESGGQATLAGIPITSSAGAMGLMQLMPQTYREMALRHGLGRDPYLPRDNILAGAAYLRALYERFGYPGLFAAYNAGPRRYGEYLKGERPLPNETRAYLAALTRAAPAADAEPPVIAAARDESAQGATCGPGTLFVHLTQTPAESSRPTSDPQPDGE
jgi:soluble lytic murein transglycosylase-like protein